MSIGAFPIGSAAIGGAVSTAVGSSGIGLDLALTIAGNSYTSNLLLDTLSITDELNSRNTCEFSLIDKTKTLHLYCGEQVRITYKGIVLFAGTVDEATEQVPDDVGEALMYQVTCVDWNQLADRHVVAVKFPAGQTFYDIISQLVNTYSDVNGGNETLASDGVTFSTATVESGPVLQKIAFNYETLADAFDSLAELTGYAWNINYLKVLHFLDRTRLVAPYPLDDDVWQQYRGLTVKRTRDQYRNIQYLRAGDGLTTTQVDSFVGDGETQTFGLKFPISAAPSLITMNGTPYLAGDIGIQQKDKNKKWYYKVGDKDITQDDAETPLTNGQTLAVTYVGLYPIIIGSRNDQEIAARQTLEGGTGVYVEVESDENVDDSDLAVEKTAALLRRFGRIQTVVESETDVDGFQAGQILNVNLADHGLKGEFLIDSVEGSMIADSFWRYSITSIDGEALGGWSSFYKRLASKGRPFVLNEDEQLLLLRQMRDQLVISDNLVTTEPLVDAVDDFLTYALVGDSLVGGVREIPASGNNYGDIYGPMIGAPTE